jgi:hypothetical protein
MLIVFGSQSDFHWAKPSGDKGVLDHPMLVEFLAMVR